MKLALVENSQNLIEENVGKLVLETMDLEKDLRLMVTTYGILLKIGHEISYLGFFLVKLKKSKFDRGDPYKNYKFNYEILNFLAQIFLVR